MYFADTENRGYKQMTVKLNDWNETKDDKKAVEPMIPDLKPTQCLTLLACLSVWSE